MLVKGREVFFIALPTSVMSAQAGIQHAAAPREYTQVTEYWIIRFRG
jgi:hypothetical protein